MIKGIEQPAMQAIRTKAVAIIAMIATAWFPFWGTGGTGVSFISASYRVLRKYLNPNRRFFLAFWPIQFRNSCKEQ
jgi:hypothetical protein